MKTVSAVELRNDLEGIVKRLRKGVTQPNFVHTSGYRGERIAEMIPAKPAATLTPLQALRRAQEIATGDPDYARKAETYLRELREDQKVWGEPSP